MSEIDEPVTLINVFTVPGDEAPTFLARWRDNAAVMAGCAGFRSADMHQAIDADAELQFVNVATWDSEGELRAAMSDATFRAAVGRLMSDPDLHVTARPAIYRVAEHVAPVDSTR